MKENKHTLLERLQGLAAFLPIFENPDFSFGKWIEPIKVEAGVFPLQHFNFSEVAESFIQTAYDLGWVLRDFDWGQWAVTVEATRLRDDEEAIDSATPDQLAKLLTVVIRQERFCDGSIWDAYNSGLITDILHRAAKLVSELEM